MADFSDEMNHVKRILVYKRTHNGDPDEDGCFGIDDCMGKVRGLEFDAVIGVGGISPDRGFEKIAYKINWIGIGAHPTKVPDKRGPEVTFDHFRGFGTGADFTKGQRFDSLAPKLAERMYLGGARYMILDVSDGSRSELYAEARTWLQEAVDWPPSRSRPEKLSLTPSAKGVC